MPGLLDIPLRETDLLPMARQQQYNQYLLDPLNDAPMAPMGLPVGEATAAGPTIRNLAREYLGRGHGDRVADLAEWTPAAAFDTASQGLLGGRDVGSLEIAGGLLDLVPGLGKGGALALKLGMAIPAWHGTPHTFKKFLMDKIGTGEGSQAYGHGLYFAGNKSVAQNYADNVHDMTRITEINQELSRLAKVIESNSGPGYRSLKNDAGREAAKRYDELMDERTAVHFAAKGNLYKVNLSPDEHQLLDWDKPLSEQSEAVQGAFKKAWAGKRMQGDSPDSATLRGLFGAEGEGLRNIDMGLFEKSSAAQAYRTMAKKYGSEAAASAALREAGVPGIKYTDQLSRGRSLPDLMAGRTDRIDTITDIRKRPPSDRNSALIAEQRRQIAEYDKLIVDYKPQTSNYVMFDAEGIEILDQGLLGPKPLK
jgi:hypothetical protein